MADIAITQMPTASALSGAEVLAGVQGGANKKVSVAQIKAFLDPAYQSASGFDNGAVGAPSIANKNDTDTGFYFPTANAIAVAAGAQERMRWKPSGATRFVPLASAPGGIEDGDAWVDAVIKNLMVGNNGTGHALSSVGVTIYPNGVNDTANIQAALDAAGNGYDKINTVNLEAGGSYYITALTMRIGVSLNFNNATVNVLPSASPGAILLPPGPVNRVSITNGRLVGNPANTGQHGFYFVAQPLAIAPFHGGFWNSVIENFEVSDFPGYQMWFRGGPGSGPYAYLLPHQFLTFKNVRLFRGAAPTSRCLVFTGQCAQMLFQNCQMDGQGIGTGGINIEISREFTNGSQVGPQSIGGSVTPNYGDGPGAFVFLECTTQSSLFGIVVDYSHTICFRDGYMEAIGRGITAYASSSNIRLEGCHLGNVGTDGSGTGYVAGAAGNSFVRTADNSVIGAVPLDLFSKVLDSSAATVKSNGDHWFGLLSSSSALYSSGRTKQMAATTTVDLLYSTDILMNAGGQDISTLKTAFFGSERIMIRAWGSLAGFDVVRFVPGGNIVLQFPLVLRHNDCVVFEQQDLAGTWVPISVQKARTESASIPTVGQFYAGEFCWVSAPQSAGNNQQLLGWSRLTTGTSHVPGVDWLPVFAHNAPAALANCSDTYYDAANKALYLRVIGAYEPGQTLTVLGTTTSGSTNAGPVSVLGGSAVNGNGGQVNVVGGGSSGSGNGADVVIRGGLGTVPGKVRIQSSASKTAMAVDPLANVIFAPWGTVPSLSNGEMVMNLITDTALRITVKGNDGVSRFVDLTLAP